MFCNKCGKEIEDDSIFCKYCGHNLISSQSTEEVSVDKKASIDANVMVGSKSAKSIKTFFTKHSRATWLYIIWTLLNCTFWIIALIEGESEYAKDYFIIGDHEPSIKYYDCTEFFLFTIIVPGLCFGLKKIGSDKYMKKIRTLCLKWIKNTKVQCSVFIIVVCVLGITAYSYFLYLGVAVVFAIFAICSLALFIYRIKTKKGQRTLFALLSFIAFGASWFYYIQHQKYLLEQASLPLYKEICSYPNVDNCKTYIQLFSTTSNANNVYNKWYNKLIEESKMFKFYSSDVEFDGTTITPLQKLEDFAEITLENNHMDLHDKAVKAIDGICDSLYAIACEYRQVQRWRKYYAFAPNDFKRDSKEKMRDACTFLYNKCYNENTLKSWNLYLTVAPDSLHQDANKRIKSLCDSMYNEALKKDDITTWKHYINNVPAEHLKDSKLRIKSLCDSMYSAAISLNNYKEWNKYIKTVPEEYLKDSKERMNKCIWRSQDTAWEYACDKNTIESYEGYLKHYPHGKNIAIAQKRVIDKTVSKAFYQINYNLPNIESNRWLSPAFSIWNGSSYSLTLYISGPTSKIVELKSRRSTEVHLSPGNYSFYAKLERNPGNNQRRYGYYYGIYENYTIATYTGKATLKNMYYEIKFD